MYRGISVGRCQSLVLQRISFYSCAWMIYWETNKNWFNKIIYTHVYYGSKFGKRFYIFIFLIYVWSLLEKLIMNIYITKLNFLRGWMINTVTTKATPKTTWATKHVLRGPRPAHGEPGETERAPRPKRHPRYPKREIKEEKHGLKKQT